MEYYTALSSRISLPPRYSYGILTVEKQRHGDLGGNREILISSVLFVPPWLNFLVLLKERGDRKWLIYGTAYRIYGIEPGLVKRERLLASASKPKMVILSHHDSITSRSSSTKCFWLMSGNGLPNILP
jgi:hypothetical protein